MVRAPVRLISVKDTAGRHISHHRGQQKEEYQHVSQAYTPQICRNDNRWRRTRIQNNKFEETLDWRGLWPSKGCVSHFRSADALGA